MNEKQDAKVNRVVVFSAVQWRIATLANPVVRQSVSQSISQSHFVKSFSFCYIILNNSTLHLKSF